MTKIEAKIAETVTAAGHYMAVWSPDGSWGRGANAAIAVKNAGNPKRFTLYQFPEDCKITSVDFTGFRVAFPETPEGEAKAVAFNWNAAIVMQVGATKRRD